MVGDGDDDASEVVADANVKMDWPAESDLQRRALGPHAVELDVGDLGQGAGRRVQRLGVSA